MPTTPRLLDQVRDRIRALHYSLRTEKTYLQWIRRFVRLHGLRHPRELGGPEVEQFLTDLAVNGKVSASTQNQALAALLFLYREVLQIDLPWLDGVTRAKQPQRVPVVLSRAEVDDDLHARAEPRRPCGVEPARPTLGAVMRCYPALPRGAAARRVARCRVPAAGHSLYAMLLLLRIISVFANIGRKPHEMSDSCDRATWPMH